MNRLAKSRYAVLAVIAFGCFATVVAVALTRRSKPVRMAAAVVQPTPAPDVVRQRRAPDPAEVTQLFALKASEFGRREKALSDFERLNLGSTHYALSKARNQVQMSDDEFDKLTLELLDSFTTRLEFELSLAQVTVAPDRVRISIPPYPDAGLRLEESLMDRFKSVLGAERGEALWGVMHPALLSESGQFGASVQTLEAYFTNDDSFGRRYSVRRTVEWMDGSSQSSTSGVMFFYDSSLREMPTYALTPYLKLLTQPAPPRKKPNP